MPETHTIALPWWQLPVLVLVLLVVLAAVGIWLRRYVRRRSAPGEERDWSVPSLANAEGTSLLHRWEVRCKIATILVFSFMVASLGSLVPALAAVGVSLLVLVLAKASPAKVLMRLMAIAGFVGMFFVVMPLTAPVHPGDTVVTFGGLEWLGFNLRGLQLAATIGAKAVAITLLMEPLLATAPLPVTLHGLSRLGAPDVIGQMVLLSYRYLHVFSHEARRMSAGMQVRGFRKRTDLQTLHAVANFLGMLFVRSFERTERVFDAMRARGYNGSFPEPETPPMKSKDLVLAAVWLIIGLALVAGDRINW
jgi:cobalt/nickel transport system permease protein